MRFFKIKFVKIEGHPGHNIWQILIWKFSQLPCHLISKFVFRFCLEQSNSSHSHRTALTSMSSISVHGARWTLPSTKWRETAWEDSWTTSRSIMQRVMHGVRGLALKSSQHCLTHCKWLGGALLNATGRTPINCLIIATCLTDGTPH